MGFITTGQTDIVIYLTHTGAEYLAGKKKSATDLIVKYFSLGDSDTNYNVLKKLSKGYVPDLTGEDSTCMKLVNINIKNSPTTTSFHRSVIYADRNNTNVIITTFGNFEKSKTAQKNDCVAGTGSTITYVVAANTYKSTISQQDADAKAQIDIDKNTQTWVNSHGECIFTHYYYTKTANFSKNDCPQYYSGSTVPYSKIYDSIISDADALAMSVADQATFNIEGQLLANAGGTCTQIVFWNIELSGIFTKNNCGFGSTGTNVSYIVPVHTYSGNTQALANAAAQNDINTKGQTYANTHGTCTPIAVPFKWIIDTGATYCEQATTTYTIALDFAVVQDTSTTAKATANPSGGGGSYTYLWSNGQTTQTATGLQKNVQYTCTVTDSNGITGTGTVTPNIAILNGLQVELMYFEKSTAITTDKYYSRLAFGSHSCNAARFNVLANGVVLGDANLNNLGGTTEPDIDAFNLPPGPYDAPSPYDRYWSKILSGIDASSIAGSDGKVTISVVYTGTGTPHSSAAWIRIKKEDGTILVSTVVSSFTGYVFDPYTG